MPSPGRAEASHKYWQHSLVLKQHLGKQRIKASSPIKDQRGLIETVNLSKLNVSESRTTVPGGAKPVPAASPEERPWSSCAHACSSQSRWADVCCDLSCRFSLHLILGTWPIDFTLACSQGMIRNVVGIWKIERIRNILPNFLLNWSILYYHNNCLI